MTEYSLMYGGEEWFQNNGIHFNPIRLDIDMVDIKIFQYGKKYFHPAQRWVKMNTIFGFLAPPPAVKFVNVENIKRTNCGQ